MSLSIGALFALGALFFWGAGDFLIQRSTRRIGDLGIIFFISLFGTVLLTPFVYRDIIRYLSVTQNLVVLSAASILLFFSALLNFEALKRGKLAAVEPILSLEIPTAAVLAFIFAKESLQPLTIFLLTFLITGLVLVSFKSRRLPTLSKPKIFEKGILLMVGAALLLGVSDFLIGFGSRITSPLMIIWFVHTTLTIYTVTYLHYSGSLSKVLKGALKIRKLVLMTCIFDNFGWISFAFAVFSIPIAIAVGISENFIVFAAMLGLIVNKERFALHQKTGFVVAVLCAVALAFLA